jgi:hypothetical protein
MTDEGEISFLLGISIQRNRDRREILLHQEKYIGDVLQRFGMDLPRPTHLPISDQAKGFTKEGFEGESDADLTEYQSIIGSIMYLMIGTRPDLAFTVSKLSRFLKAPKHSHRSAAIHALRYIATTKGCRLKYAAASQVDNSDPFKSIECYCDSDYASDLDKRRSTSGYAVLFHGGAISWYSKRQSVVAQSSTEAEYIALCKAAKEIVWIRHLINEITSFTSFSTTSTVPITSISIADTTPVIVRIDNQSAMKLASNPVNHQQSKHIDVMYHFTRKALKDRIITLLYTPTTENVADILTKPLSRRLIEKHRFGLGIVIASLSG